MVSSTKYTKLVSASALLAVLCLGFTHPLTANAEDLADLAELSIEELFDVKVSLVSRKLEKLSLAPAAISVITREDILRAGITSLPEALRLVPGFHVAHIDANKWAVSARGFNHRFANKLLVQIDGRSVYNFSFSGVFWEAQDVLFEDLERIEVIRGPGATLWGANAVNGIINIVTKKAAETQNLLLVGGGGSEERGFGSVRYGGKLAADTHYRLYAKYGNHHSSVDAAGNATNDAWRTGRAGFRVDREKTGDHMRVQGEWFSNNMDQTILSFSPTVPAAAPLAEATELTGGHLLGSWQRNLASETNLGFQVYYDYLKRSEFAYGEAGHTLDLDLQLHRQFKRHGVIIGAGYRRNAHNTDESFMINVDQDHLQTHLFSGFIQDDIDLVEDKMRLVLGTKLEHNTYTGLEIQPNLRLLFALHPQHTLWGAVSRAIRSPSRADRDVQILMSLIPGEFLPEGSPNTFIALEGSSDFDSEKLRAFEVGYRFQRTENFYLDLASYYNIYSDMTDIVAATPRLSVNPSPYIVIPTILNNTQKSDSYGIEMAVKWQPLNRWQLWATYAYLHLESTSSADAQPISDPLIAAMLNQISQFQGNTKNIASLRSTLDLHHNVSLDGMLRYTDKIGKAVDDYLELDLHLGWTLSPGIKFSLTGLNLLKNHHAEFLPTVINTESTQLERSVHGALTLSLR